MRETGKPPVQLVTDDNQSPHEHTGFWGKEKRICGRRFGAAMSTELPRIEVITDSVVVEAARTEWAEQREMKVAKLLREPKAIHAWDDEALGLLREQRPQSLAALAALRDPSHQN